VKEVNTYIKIQDGKLHIEKSDQFARALTQLPDGLYTFQVRKVYDTRTNQQNKYYWGVVVPAFVVGYREITGESISLESAHETLKGQFNSEDFVNPDTGEVVKVVKSTTKQKTVEFMEYVEHCRRFIAEWMHTETPDPM
jgi:hypothetical protein